jgi:hypothetical protein
VPNCKPKFEPTNTLLQNGGFGGVLRIMMLSFCAIALIESRKSNENSLNFIFNGLIIRYCLKFYFSFVLKQKKQKFKKRSSACAQAGIAPATFSGHRAALNSVRCGGSQRKVRTASFVAIWRKIFASKTKLEVGFRWVFFFVSFFWTSKRKKNNFYM